MSASQPVLPGTRFACFTAPSNINCMDIGRNSRQVLATGNADRDVSLFSVRAGNPSMTLTGHTSPVESVKFEESEEIVLAGSLGGVIKAWDLRAPKFLCSLRGHAGPVRCLDTFSRQYVASGSVDNYVKIWDLRTDGSCFTYAGHEKSVNSVQFSPNGSWLVSTSGDGTAKIWDLLAGKLLYQFVSNRYAMTFATFHPHELMLATSNSGGEVQFLDLEVFTEISCVRGPPATHGLYYDDRSSDQFVYALSPTRVAALSWEPPGVLEQLPLDTFSPSPGCPQMIAKFGAPSASSASQMVVFDAVDNTVGAYLLPDLIAQRNDSGAELSKAQVGGIPATDRSNRSSRRSFAESGRGHDLKLNSKEDNLISGAVQREPSPLPDDPGAIFVPNRTLVRSPPRQRRDPQVPQGRAPPQPVRPMAKNGPSNQNQARVPQSLHPEPRSDPSHSNLSPNFPTHAPKPVAASTPNPGQGDSQATAPGQSFVRKIPPNAGSKPTPATGPGAGGGSAFNFPPRDGTSPRARTIATVIPQRPQCTSGTQTSTPKSTPDYSPKSESSENGDDLGISYLGVDSSSKYDLSSSVVSSGYQYSDASNSNPSHLMSGMSGMTLSGSASPRHARKNGQSGPDDDVLSSVHRDAPAVCNALEQRMKLWSNAMASWRREGPRGALDYAQMSGNEAFEAEVLGVLATRRTLWTLDLCAMALPRLRQFLAGPQAGFEDDLLVQVAIPCLRLILRDFAGVLKSGIRPGASIGVDIVQEERRQKCTTCMHELAEIKQWIASPLARKRNNIFYDEIGLLLKCID